MFWKSAQLIVCHSLLDLLWFACQTSLLSLQISLLLRQSLPKIILESAPHGLRAGLADAGLLCTRNA
jgi:hypothetical protein